MKRPEESFVLLISFAIFISLYLLYILSLNPVLPTGDAGGLITASYFLGTAHPPGYPFYSELGKLFSFIPIGNIGFRVSLLPLFFSIFTLLMVRLILNELLSLRGLSNQSFESGHFSELNLWCKKLVPPIAILILGVSYSFYFQTIIGKFYPLNAAMIMLLFFLGIMIIRYDFDERYFYLSAFILGLSTGLHHTALFMAIPFFILSLSRFKNTIKIIPLLILFFLIGFSINLHIIIRNSKEIFFALRKEGEITPFFDIFFRKVYKQGASLEATKSAFASFEGYLKGLKNFIYMIDANFSIVTLIFFVIGFLFIFRNNRKIFYFIAASFFMYSVFLSKITLSGDISQIPTLYISGNQYFIPAFCIYLIVTACGIYYSLTLLRRFKIAFFAFVSLILLLFISFIPLRYSQTSQENNWVVYYYCKDLLTFPPISSVITTFTDNQIFGIWYLKLIGRYRDDICHISIIKYDSTQWNMEGCKPFNIYESHELKKGNISQYTERGLFYSTIGLTPVHSLSKVAKMNYTFGGFIYLPKTSLEDINNFLDERVKRMKNLFTLDYCYKHKTDDPSTFSTCKYVGLNSLVIARSIKPKIKITKYEYQTSFIFDEGVIPIKVDIDLGKENVEYIEVFDEIGRYNDYKRTFLKK